jgi:hypothetical protein
LQDGIYFNINFKKEKEEIEVGFDGFLGDKI